MQTPPPIPISKHTFQEEILPNTQSKPLLVNTRPFPHILSHLSPKKTGQTGSCCSLLSHVHSLQAANSQHCWSQPAVAQKARPCPRACSAHWQGPTGKPHQAVEQSMAWMVKATQVQQQHVLRQHFGAIPTPRASGWLLTIVLRWAINPSIASEPNTVWRGSLWQTNYHCRLYNPVEFSSAQQHQKLQLVTLWLNKLSTFYCSAQGNQVRILGPKASVEETKTSNREKRLWNRRGLHRRLQSLCRHTPTCNGQTYVSSYKQTLQLWWRVGLKSNSSPWSESNRAWTNPALPLFLNGTLSGKLLQQHRLSRVHNGIFIYIPTKIFSCNDSHNKF